VTINKAALDLICEFEGFRATTYFDSAGVATIGYGTTAAAGVGIEPYPGLTITKAAATHYLMAAIEKFEGQIRPHVKVPVTENEWGALVSLAYNIGPGAFIKSTLLRKLNAGDRAGAAAQFLVWNKAGGRVLRGLERRRAAERALFLSPPPVAASPAPDPVIKPAVEVPAQSGWAAIIAAIMRLFKGA
jgi:lysozyme